MTPGTFDEIKKHAASLWIGEYADQTPVDAFGTAAPAMMKIWLRERKFPVGSESEVRQLAQACRDAAKMMGRVRVQEFQAGQEG